MLVVLVRLVVLVVLVVLQVCTSVRGGAAAVEALFAVAIRYGRDQYKRVLLACER